MSNGFYYEGYEPTYAQGNAAPTGPQGNMSQPENADRCRALLEHTHRQGELTGLFAGALLGVVGAWLYDQYVRRR